MAEEKGCVGAQDLAGFSADGAFRGEKKAVGGRVGSWGALQPQAELPLALQFGTSGGTLPSGAPLKYPIKPKTLIGPSGQKQKSVNLSWKEDACL